MSKLRRQLSSGTVNIVETRNLNDIKDKTGNLYESISIVGKRANQINISLKEEFHNKLEEFASHTDSLEEIHENKEQIEISRAYERMPNPALLATQEFWMTRSISGKVKTTCLAKTVLRMNLRPVDTGRFYFRDFEKEVVGKDLKGTSLFCDSNVEWQKNINWYHGQHCCL